MKKRITMLLICIFIISSITGYAESCYNTEIKRGYEITYNDDKTECISIIYNDTHYVPMRGIFEKMGAMVFYRAKDRQILSLTRDGDMIRHISGENSITVNDNKIEFEKPSLLLNSTVYIPVEMLSAALCTDYISYGDGILNIGKQVFTCDYHKNIKEVLDEYWRDTFCEENFREYIKFRGENPSYSMEEVLFRVNTGLNHPFYENAEVISQPYQLLTLVNKYNQLPSGFSQYNLCNMDSRYTARDGKEYLLAGVANESYIKMAEAANNAGLSMRVVSAYRTEDYQRNLYNNKLRTTGLKNAERYSARPGFSEHQLGLAVDINSTKGSFEYTNEFKWLQEHAHEYGFILRYPKGKEWITGYAYEPWHYRYVGTEAAKIVFEEDITYEEFYIKYIKAKEFN